MNEPRRSCALWVGAHDAYIDCRHGRLINTGEDARPTEWLGHSSNENVIAFEKRAVELAGLLCCEKSGRPVAKVTVADVCELYQPDCTSRILVLVLHPVAVCEHTVCQQVGQRHLDPTFA